MVYGSTDGGAHWTDLTANLPAAPANSVVVDPQDANTVYLATDAGVYSTRQIANCVSVFQAAGRPLEAGCRRRRWLRSAPLPRSAPVQDLVAATYGRGIWMTPLWTARPRT